MVTENVVSRSLRRRVSVNQVPMTGAESRRENRGALKQKSKNLQPERREERGLETKARKNFEPKS